MKTNTTQKAKYKAPTISLILIEIEEGVATGSAITKPQSRDDVSTEWEIGTDESISFNWN